jgi:hypothetical protein
MPPQQQQFGQQPQFASQQQAGGQRLPPGVPPQMQLPPGVSPQQFAAMQQQQRQQGGPQQQQQQPQFPPGHAYNFAPPTPPPPAAQEGPLDSSNWLNMAPGRYLMLFSFLFKCRHTSTSSLPFVLCRHILQGKYRKGKLIRAENKMAFSNSFMRYRRWYITSISILVTVSLAY